MTSALGGLLDREGFNANDVDITLLMNNLRSMIEKKVKEIDTFSFLTFVSSTNADALDASFGKNNVGRIHGVGKSLAMYAWFKGSTDNFINLLKCDTLDDILINNDAYMECLNSTHAMSLIVLSPWANGNFKATIIQSSAMPLAIINNAINKSFTTFAEVNADTEAMAILLKKSWFYYISALNEDAKITFGKAIYDGNLGTDSILVDSEEMRLYFKITVKSYNEPVSGTISDRNIVRVVRLLYNQGYLRVSAKIIFTNTSIPYFEKLFAKDGVLNVSLAIINGATIVIDNLNAMYITEWLEFSIK